MRAPLRGEEVGKARPAIELRIGELILEGFATGEGPRIRAAIERELALLLASQEELPPALRKGGERPALDGGSFELRAGEGPESVGRGIARAIYGGLGK